MGENTEKTSKQTGSKISRSLKIGLDKAEGVSEQLDLPPAVEEKASSLYRSSFEKGLIQGRSREGFLAATFLVACREHSIANHLKDFADHFEVSPNKARRAHLTLIEGLSLSPPFMGVSEWIDDHLDSLLAPRKVREKVHEIAAKAENLEISSETGLSTETLAVAAVYLASREEGCTIPMGVLVKRLKISRAAIGEAVAVLREKLPEGSNG